MQFKTVQEYWDHLRHILAQKGFVSESHKIQLSPISKRKRVEGVITADNITFQDGATLRFLESVAIENDVVEFLEYSYHFENTERYFRYDKDPKRARGLAHPECHLHVSGHNDIRYVTHETNFTEVFDFIIACFYSGQSN